MEYGSKVAAGLGFTAATITLFIAASMMRYGDFKIGIPLLMFGVGMAAVAYGIYALPSYSKIMGVAMFAVAFLPPMFSYANLAYYGVPFAAAAGVWAILWRPKASAAQDKDVH